MSTSVTQRPDVVRDVAALHGDARVVSMYVDSRPERKMHGRPAWAIPLRHALAAAGEDRAVRDHVASLDAAIAELMDPNGPGRGRALFSAIGGATIGPLWTQGTLPDQVSVAEYPSLGPLLVAVDDARPAGIVVVTGTWVRVIETRGADAADVARFDYDDQSSEWREMRGPAGPGRGTYESASQADLFARRLDTHHEHWLGGLAGRLIQIRESRGWDETLVIAEPRTTAGLVEHAPALHRVADRHGLHQGSATAVAAELRPALVERRRSVRGERVRTAIDMALAGSHGAVGWDDVAAAVAEGRAHSLFLDVPTAASSRPEDAGAVDELIVRALETDAEVVPVDGSAAQGLAVHGGIAAALRW